MKVAPIRTRVFKEGEDLLAFIVEHVPRLKDASVLVVTSKIVALSEGSVVQASTSSAKGAIIRAESEWQLQAKYGKITLKDGLLMWNAGTDESNAKGNIILLPKDSFVSAALIRKALKRHYKIKKLG